MIITSTSSIEGYQITEYLGVVTAAETYTIGGIIGEGVFKQGLYFSNAMNRALQDMKGTAARLHADAVVGVQTSVTAMSSIGNVVVTVIGTAVKTKNVDEEEQEPIITIPVHRFNVFDPILPNYISLKPESREMALSLAYKGEKVIKAIRADIIILSEFGECKIESEHFFSFGKMHDSNYQSKSIKIDIPQYILETIIYIDVIIKEFILDGIHSTVETYELINEQEKVELLEKRRKENMDKSVLAIENFQQYNKARDMLQYVDSIQEKIPEELFKKLTNELKERATFERLYGSKNSDTISAIEHILDNEG